MSLMEKMLKAAPKKRPIGILKDSQHYKKQVLAHLPIPVLNLPFSGKLDGGIVPGLTMLVGDSATFKTSLSLVAMAAFLEQNPEGIAIFYDGEFGAAKIDSGHGEEESMGYFESMGVDTARVIYNPIENIEQLKFDMVHYLDQVEEGDKIFMFVDSVGNLPSKKEAADALDGNSVADMTRAKEISSLARTITPMLNLRKIPAIVINHQYSCGTEEVMVKMENGVQSLKDIKVGDVVLTTNGYEPVQYTTHHKDAIVTEIELEDGNVLAFTNNHKLRVNGEWIEVIDLQPRMEIDKIPI